MRLLILVTSLACALADHFYDKKSLAGGYFNLKRPDPRCKRVGHYLPHPYDPCKYMVCDYGKEPWRPQLQGILLYTREMRCPSGLAASRKAFYDTKIGQHNPCIVLDDKCLVAPDPKFQVPLLKNHAKHYGPGYLEPHGPPKHYSPAHPNHVSTVHHGLYHVKPTIPSHYHPKPYHNAHRYDDKAHHVDYREILRHFGMAYLNHGRLPLTIRPVYRTPHHSPPTYASPHYQPPEYQPPKYVTPKRQVAEYKSPTYVEETYHTPKNPPPSHEKKYVRIYDNKYEPAYPGRASTLYKKLFETSKLHSESKFI